MTYSIETYALRRDFDKRTVVNELTLHIPEGSVFGFLGPNGAGKTTTVRMLAALIAPTDGEATIAGYTVGKDNDAIRRTVGILTETPGLYDNMTAAQNLAFYAQMYDVPRAEATKRIERFLKMMALWDRRDDRVGGFSKGMRQKVAIIRALLHRPRVLFLDEPTSGLDPEAAHLIRQFIKALRSEGHTVFVTTHNLAEAEELCDEIGIFRTRLLRMGTVAQLRQTTQACLNVRVRVQGDGAAWLAAAQALPFVQSARNENDVLNVELAEDDIPSLVTALAGQGARIYAVEPQARSLQDVYLELIKQ
jgi:ABC-2 type transport system ATP-binding protein